MSIAPLAAEACLPGCLVFDEGLAGVTLSGRVVAARRCPLASHGGVGRLDYGRGEVYGG